MARPLSEIYGRVIAKKNARFDRGFGVTVFDQRVISVGNLSAGGTGKTPLVQWVVRAMRDEGHHPAIAMRGYGATQDQRSDEELEHADAFPDVPIVAQKDRINGLGELFKAQIGSEIDTVVLDDGFQHRQIGRDVDLVVIDASRPAHTDALLPLGFLREPMSSLDRADAVILTHTERVTPEALENTVQEVRRFVRDDILIAVSEHAWDAIRVYRSGADMTSVSPDSLKGELVFAMSAIGNPSAFHGSVEDLGAAIVGHEIRPDHDGYSDAVLDRVTARIESAHCKSIITTRKDWSKLEDRLLTRLGPGGQVCVPELSIRFVSGESALRRLCLNTTSD